MRNFDKLEPLFAQRPYIAAAYLFGSSARARSGALSDIDIAILQGENAPQGAELLEEQSLLEYQIQVLLKYPRVDVIALNHQGLIFQHNVLRTGRLIYDNDPQFRKKFEWNIILNYCDFEPTLRLIEKYHLRGRLRRCEIL